MHDRLRVGVIGGEDVASCLLQLAPDRGVVVDLAVEEQPDGAVLVRHRLHCTVVEVDDCEPAEAETDRAVVGDPVPAAVRAAVVDRLAHARHVLVRCAECATTQSQDAGDAAHGARW
jgi:hypothetical protein